MTDEQKQVYWLTSENVSFSEEEKETMERVFEKLYGPKFCMHCNKIQPIVTHVLRDSQQFELEGNQLTMSFTGATCCRVCGKLVEGDNTIELGKEEGEDDE